MKKLLFGLLFGTAIVFSACEKNEEIVPATDFTEPGFNVTVESVVTLDASVGDVIESVDYEVDLFSGSSDALTDVSADANMDSELKGATMNQHRLRYRDGKSPNVTVDWNQEEFPRTITIDYGEETELENGRIISGIVEIVISAPFNTEGATRTVTFTDFSIDSLSIIGTIEKTVLNVTDGREVQIVRDLIVTLPDGTELQCYSELIRTWIQGMGTPFYHSDDEMGIAGFSTCEDSDGNVYRKEIKEQLMKKGGCRYIVRGEVMFSANGKTFGSINYGDGSCDNVAVMQSVRAQKQFTIGKHIRERNNNQNSNNSGR